MAKKKTPQPTRISQKRLVRIFKDIKAQNSEDNRFCFLLGAGASKSSGIKTGWELSERWYEEIVEDLTNDELKTWEKAIDFDKKKIGEFYSHIYKKRYESCHQIGYDEFKRMMESAEPGLGYVILARLLSEEKHNFVITTNFDYLIEDAIRMYTSTKPFTAGHEIMAQFISSQTERPTIIKVHRDLLLNPFNDQKETEKLKEEWGRALLPIVKNFGLLVIGYGGNDGSLMDYLMEVGAADRKPIYWCVRNENEINEKIVNLLTVKDFIVKIEGFDELMYSFDFAMNYKTFKALEDVDNHQLVIGAKKRVEHLEEKRKELFEKLQEEKPEDISEETKEIFTDAEQYILKAAYEDDFNKKEVIYKEAIEKFPSNAKLLGSYAVYIHNNKKNYDIALQYYEKAIALDNKNAVNLNNYAVFLQNIKNDYDKAEKYYKQAVHLEPDSSLKLGNYASFLKNERKDYDKAEEYYKKALYFDDLNARLTGDFALLYTDAKKDYEKANEFFNKAINLDNTNANNLSNYAHFLIISKQDFKQASEYIKKSFKYTVEDTILVELWFYLYAHYPERREEAEKELEKLIKKGAKSIGWNFEDHIKIAKENGYPNLKKLQEFADAISKE